MISSQEEDGEIFQKPSDIANIWPLLIELLLKGFTKKSVMVEKSFKKSLRWVQSGISSFIRSKVMSKTREIERIEEKINDLENHPKSS